MKRLDHPHIIKLYQVRIKKHIILFVCFIKNLFKVFHLNVTSVNDTILYFDVKNIRIKPILISLNWEFFLHYAIII